MKLTSLFNSETGKWEVVDLEELINSGGGSSVIISDTEPLDAPVGAVWIDTSDDTIDEQVGNGDTEVY